MDWRGERAEREGTCEPGEGGGGKGEFQTGELGDKSLEQRWQKRADDLAGRPQAPIPQARADGAATQAAYRFFENPTVSEPQIFAAHRTRTGQRLAGQSVVLASQDTTYLNYTHHPRTMGLGSIGDRRSDAQGLSGHSLLVVTPEGLPVGLLTPEQGARAGYKPQSVRERQNPAIEEKESYRWLAARQETVAEAPAAPPVVTLCAREADSYELLAEAQRLSAKFVIRAAWERHIAHDDYPHLWPLIESQAVAGSVTVEVPPREKPKPRQGRRARRFTAVTLEPPQRHRAVVPAPLPPLSL